MSRFWQRLRFKNNYHSSWINNHSRLIYPVGLAITIPITVTNGEGERYTGTTNISNWYLAIGPVVGGILTLCGAGLYHYTKVRNLENE